MTGLIRILVGTLVLSLLSSPALVAQAEQNKVPPAALVVRVEGDLSVGTLALINRAAREIVDLGAKYLILDIASQKGGLADLRAVHDKLQALRAKDIETIAYVREFAWSAAALIALSCDQIYMGRDASLGAVSIQERSEFTNEQLVVDPEEQKQIKEMLLATVRDTPKDNRTVRLLLEAMADREIKIFLVNYKDDAGIENNNAVVREEVLTAMRADPKIEFGFPEPEEFKARPLTLTPEQGIQFGLVNSVADSLELMIEERLLLEPSQVVRMEESWSENFATFLNEMRTVLFVLGFILLLVELKTPGFALPGILGAIMFGLAFFGAYTVGLANIGEVLLFFAGLGMLAVEIFILPGTIVFGVLGFLCIVSGLILAQQPFFLPSTDAESDLMLANFLNFGLVMLVVMLGSWVIYANIHRIPILRNAVRFPPEPHSMGSHLGEHQERYSALLGQTGVLATDLRPTGWMEVGSERFDVVSEGSFINKGTTVEVVEVRGNRIVVAEAPTGAAPAGGESGEVTIGWLVFLMLVGFALVVAEVFFVSFGVLGILSGVSLVSAVFLAFAHHESWVGFLFLIGSAIGVPLTVKYALVLMPHTPVGRQLFLEGNKHEEVSGAAQQEGLASLLHQPGVALCDLRPSGYARIGGRRVDVVTRGELLPKDCPLKVIKIESNQVVVARSDHDS